MYRDQFGEIVCKYWGLKGWGVELRTSKKQTELVVGGGLNSRPPDCEFNVLTTQALSNLHLCSHLHCCYILKSFLFRKVENKIGWTETPGYFWHTITKLVSYQLICRAVCCHNQVKLLKETVIFVRDILNISSYFNHWIQLLGTLEWTLSTLHVQKDNKQNNTLIRLVRNCLCPEPAWKKGMGMKIGLKIYDKL